MTQNMANSKLHKNKRKFVEGWMGGMRSSLLICSVRFGLLSNRSRLTLSSIGIDTLKNFFRVMLGLKNVGSVVVRRGPSVLVMSSKNVEFSSLFTKNSAIVVVRYVKLSKFISCKNSKTVSETGKLSITKPVMSASFYQKSR